MGAGAFVVTLAGDRFLALIDDVDVGVAPTAELASDGVAVAAGGGADAVAFDSGNAAGAARTVVAATNVGSSPTSSARSS